MFTDMDQMPEHEKSFTYEVNDDYVFTVTRNPVTGFFRLQNEKGGMVSSKLKGSFTNRSEVIKALENFKRDLEVKDLVKSNIYKTKRPEETVIASSWN